MYELMAEETFDAAHALRGYEGACENLHGHSWRVQVFLRGTRLNKIGLLEDFKVVRKHLAEVLADFDHKLLNDVPPFGKKNPTSENLAENISRRLKKKFKNLAGVRVWESPATYAEFR
ncbi:MAG: 6-carboxytetrahydropterin synthase QueD [Candidatus Saganbacteria bacterium]|nr:6-carboxytetrahydropterin synthase QueD [Candidatus Saganbacteria bacterium]